MINWIRTKGSVRISLSNWGLRTAEARIVWNLMNLINKSTNTLNGKKNTFASFEQVLISLSYHKKVDLKQLIIRVGDDGGVTIIIVGSGLDHQSSIPERHSLNLSVNTLRKGIKLSEEY